MTGTRLTIPDVLPLFNEFRNTPGNEVGGVLHIVLSDSNTEDSHVLWCLQQADATGDTLGARLAAALLAMTRTQRGVLARRFYDG